MNKIATMENKIYESWAEEQFPFKGKREDNYWNLTLIEPEQKAYVQGCNKMEDVCLRFAEWIHVSRYQKHPNTEWYFNEPPTAGEQVYFNLKELFQYFINNVYNGLR